MNYILLDLEWDNSYFKKKQGFINEIIEFGAVKLDENLREVDRFCQVVRSQVSKKLSNRFRNLTGMTNEQMLAGVDFSTALEKYKNWAGEDTITLTWSNSDLYAIYENCKYFSNSAENAKLGKYADLQSYFQYVLRKLGKTGDGNQISLSNAAALFKIELDGEVLHHAVDDSSIAAAILRKTYKEEDFVNFIKDTNNDEFYKRLLYKPYYINDINSPFIERKQLKFSCPECNNKVKRISKWKFKIPWFICTFHCTKCNVSFKGGVSFKRLYDNTVIRKKIFINKRIEKITETSNKNKASVKE